MPHSASQVWTVLPKDDNSSEFQIQSKLNGMCVDGARYVPPPPGPPHDLGVMLAAVDVGAGSDTAADQPIVTAMLPSLSPGEVSSALFFVPSSGNSSTRLHKQHQEPTTTAAGGLEPWQCPTPASVRALAATTDNVWTRRLVSEAPAAVKTWDPRIDRAIAVAIQQLWMMTELQPDGLRVIKGPMHYYGSDPYDTYRVTHALQQVGFVSLAERILDRQMSRLCRNGMWQMWETDPPQDAPQLCVIPPLFCSFFCSE